MRLVTFVRKNQQRVGLMGPQDQIIDLAEVNRRYLKGGNAPFLASMQAFIEAGGKALQLARKAEKYVAGKNPDEQKKLVAAGALVKPTQAKIISPIPTPRKNCVMLGINYREHVDEGARARQLEIKYPDYPVFFTKPATSVGPLEGDEWGDPVPCELEAGHSVMPCKEVVLGGGRPDGTQELPRLLEGALRENPSDNKSDRQAVGRVGELGHGVDTEPDATTVERVGGHDSRDGQDKGFEVRLAALETRQAGESLVSIIAMGVIAAGLVFSAWLALVGAVMMSLVERGLVSASTALLMAMAANVLIAVILIVAIRRNSRRLLLSATVSSLAPTPPDASHPGTPA